MKKYLVLWVLIVLCIFQAGCWSRKELSQISIVMAAAVDQAAEKDKIIFTIQVVNPSAMKKAPESGGGGTAKPFYIAASSGFTLGDAERHLYAHVTRPIFWQHMRVLIISEDLARTNLAALIDSLDRVAAFRRKMLLLVTPGKARDALGLEEPVEKLSGQAIYNLAREDFKHSQAYYPSDINDFLKALSRKGIEPVLARLEIKKPAESPLAIGKPDDSKGDLTETLEMSGSAVFKSEKMVGWLNSEETKGLLWVRGKAKNVMLVLKYPGSKDKEELVTVLSQMGNSSIRPELVNGKLQMTVAIKTEGRIAGQSFTTRDPSDPENIKILDRQYVGSIKREIRQALTRAQGEYNADVFGFGLTISRKYPKLWKELGPKWDDEFRRLGVNIKVTANIRRMGLTLKPTRRE
jgi:spore germination protein KC